MKDRGRHRPLTVLESVQQERRAIGESLFLELHEVFGIEHGDVGVLPAIAKRVRYEGVVDCWVCQDCGTLFGRGFLRQHFETHGGGT